MKHIKMLAPNIFTNTVDIQEHFFIIKHGIYITLTNPRLFK